MMTRVLVIGAGAWGTALAMLLARNGHQALLWDSNVDHITDLQASGSNDRHLPGIQFPAGVEPVTSIENLLDSLTVIVIAVPCEGLRDVMAILQGRNPGKLMLCLASKGLDPNTLGLNHLVVKEYLGDVPVAVLSGPSFAAEVAAGLPTAVTIAAEKNTTAEFFSDLFHSDFFRTYTNDDIIGVQISGAVKNVMAIAAGIADGLGYGTNARAAMITRGLAEITRLGVAMGGRQETFMGLAGLGDLVLTCTDDQSRNRRLGLLLARGKSQAQAVAEIGQAIEGLKTVKVINKLAGDYGIEMPISEQVFNVLYKDVPVQEAVQVLLARDRKPEIS